MGRESASLWDLSVHSFPVFSSALSLSLVFLRGSVPGPLSLSRFCPSPGSLWVPVILRNSPPPIWFSPFLFLLWGGLGQGEGGRLDGPDLEAGWQVSVPGHLGEGRQPVGRVVASQPPHLPPVLFLEQYVGVGWTQVTLG